MTQLVNKSVVRKMLLTSAACSVFNCVIQRVQQDSYKYLSSEYLLGPIKN